jgi:hypothetical protein
VYLLITVITDENDARPARMRGRGPSAGSGAGRGEGTYERLFMTTSRLVDFPVPQGRSPVQHLVALHERIFTLSYKARRIWLIGNLMRIK